MLLDSLRRPKTRPNLSNDFLDVFLLFCFEEKSGWSDRKADGVIVLRESFERNRTFENKNVTEC